MMSKLAEIFQKEIGMTLPYIPEPFGKLLPLFKPYDKCLLFGSKVAVEKPYLVQGSISEFLETATKGYFLIGFWGHGVNSYAFYYSRVDSRSKVFFRLGYGGAYMDNELEAKHIREFLSAYFSFEKKIADKVENIVAIDSMMSGFYKVTLPDGSKYEIKESLLDKPHFEDRFDHILESTQH